MSDPRAQETYQVRFAVGARGMKELAGADIVLIADQLDPDVTADVAEPDSTGIDGAGGAAARVMAEQERRGRRVSVAVVARGRHDVSFPVEDVLAAGAVIDALAALGIDHCSPEAAAAAAAYSGLRRATRHLVSASVTGRLRRGESPSS